MARIQKKECPLCGRLISVQNFNKHVVVCNGVIENKYGLHNFKKCDDGEYECPHCKKKYCKNGISSHVWRIHGNGEKHNPRKGIKNIPAWNKGLLMYDDEFYLNTDKFKQFINEYKNKYSENSIRRHFKKYLITQNGNTCSICKETTWMNKPIPLVCDHIDGDSYNNEIDNVRLVCGNCDMQLPTYKSKNLGNGRKERRKIK